MPVENGVSIDLLKNWLKVLEDAMDRMRVDQQIFREVFAIICGNPGLARELIGATPSFFCSS